MGEFQTLANPRPLSALHEVELSEFESLWLSERTQIAASEFVGSSLIAGEPERASEAAKMLEQQGENEFLRRLGKRAVQPSVTAGFANVAEEGQSFLRADLLHRRVALQKTRVLTDPRNAIAWADLARWYTALGRFRHAKKALVVARTLAPTSRYLLRSASKFYVHIGEPESAYALLRDSPRTFEDPWLMAAYLAVASVGQLKISSLRPARRILEDSNFRPIEIAELESEIATLEMRSGRDRRARIGFEKSLTCPTDNSLAQVEWASRQLGTLDLDLETISVPFAAEALARSAIDDGDWAEALVQAELWLDDQPRDTNAALVGSYVASVGLEEWEVSADIARVGLRARPGDVMLTNNLAYALIESGRLREAGELLGRLDLSALSGTDRIVVAATLGLLQFRLGDLNTGGELYSRSIELARRKGDRGLEVTARAMLLRELRASAEGDEIDRLVEMIRSLVKDTKDPGVLICVRRAEIGLVLGGSRPDLTDAK